MSISIPWYVVGSGMGLTVAGLYAVANKHLGGIVLRDFVAERRVALPVRISKSRFDSVVS